jgi:hypothetical protein
VFQRGNVRHVEWPEERRRIEIGNVKLSSNKLMAITKWEPGYDFMSGLQHTKTILEHNGL